MQICPNCKAQNRTGAIFCENCGASLIGDAPLGTKTIGIDLREGLAGTAAEPGVEVLGVNTIIRLEIEGSQPIFVKPRPEIVFGRRDPASGAMPDVDLTPFAGFRMGVSRKHAALRPSSDNRLDLWDLGSSNGTYLNGIRLQPNRPNRVHDGDEIRLGQMVIRIFFQVVSENTTE